MRQIDVEADHVIRASTEPRSPDGGDPVTASEVRFDFTPANATDVAELRITDDSDTPVWTLLIPNPDGDLTRPFIPRGGLTPERTYTWSVEALDLREFNANHFQHVEFDRLEIARSNSGPRQFETK